MSRWLCGYLHCYLSCWVGCRYLINFPDGTDYDDQYAVREWNIVRSMIAPKYARLNVQNVLGWTALHLAAFWGQQNVTRELLRAGARHDLTTYTRDGGEWSAAGAGGAGGGGGKGDGDEWPTTTDSSYAHGPVPSTAGLTALQLALVAGHCACVELLLEAGSQPAAWMGGGDALPRYVRTYERAYAS